MLSNVASWVSHPFSEDMSLWSWVLFLVVILTISVLWLQILHHITEE